MFRHLLSNVFIKRFLFTRSQLMPNSVQRRLILIYIDNKPQQTADDDNSNEMKILSTLSKRIKKELNQVYLNALETDKLIESPQVPYTVIITQQTLFDGILKLKHFEPKINEEVHVTQLTDRLLLQTGATALRCYHETVRSTSPPTTTTTTTTADGAPMSS